MRFCSLGSGSSGNATVVEAGGTRLLVDCGFALREAEARLARAGLEPAQVDAIFVTHEHGDHAGSALAFARRHGVPLWTSRGTWHALGEPEVPTLHFARDGDPIAVGALELSPFTVPHDAREPLQLRIGDGAHSLGLLTDCGSATAHLVAALQGCDGLVLECNHDRALLAASSYPVSLKARIGGRHGHLANDAAAAILAACLHDGLKRLVAAHLSEQNNRPELARAALAGVLGGGADDIVVADAASGCGWMTLAGER